MNFTRNHILFILIVFSLSLKVAYISVIPAFFEDYKKESIAKIYTKLAKNNDAWWYQKIIDNGYPDVSNERELGRWEWPDFKQSEWAFSPMYPMMIKFINKTTNVKSDYSSIIISIVLSTLAIIGIFWFAYLFFGEKEKALFTTFLFFTFPFHFYYSVFYTESLFLSTLIFSFIAIKKQNYKLLALLLIPLVLIRPNGLVALVPLYLYHLESNNLLSKYTVEWKKLFDKQNILKSIFFLSGILAFAAYCWYQYQHTGFYNAFSIAQKGWGKKLTFPLFSLYSRSGIAHIFHSSYTIFWMLFALLSWKRLPLSLNIFIWLNILFPLSGGSVISMARYISVIFPLFFILAHFLYRLKLKYLIVFALFSLQLYTLFGFVTNQEICF